jgi:hypothetical protein
MATLENGQALSRQKRFHMLLSKYCERSSEGFDPFMEALVALVRHLNKGNREDMCKSVKTQLSHDTVASFAIILCPFSQNCTQYVNDECYNAWLNEYNFPHSSNVFCVNQVNLYDEYCGYMKEGEKAGEGLVNEISSEQKQQSGSITKPTAIKQLKTLYRQIADKVNTENIGQYRATALQNVDKSMAESELRVLSALWHDNGCDHNEAKQLFCHNCCLDTPYFLNSDSNILDSDLACYFSLVYFLVNSKSVLHFPCTSMNTAKGFSALLNLSNEEVICLDKDIYDKNNVHRNTYYQNQYSKFKQLLDLHSNNLLNSQQQTTKEEQPPAES